jgi:alkanesulfonate monooxygenase SsuD/methylene tetrahydromethanopterin reductase-like flavin-dependent oxidoreductase (luciferase family)
MGIGAAWKEEEFTALGIPFPPLRERIERLDEACTVLRKLWTEDRPSFDGQYYQLADAIAEPKPIQRPYPPLWIGGAGRNRTLRVVARHADVWSSNARERERDLELMDILDEHCRTIGRDPSTIRRCVSIRWGGHRTVSSSQPIDDLAAESDATLRAAEWYAKAGFSEIIFMVMVAGDEGRRMVDALSSDILRRARSLGAR